MGHSTEGLQSSHLLDLPGAASWQHLFQPDGFWLQRIMQNSNECKQRGRVFIRSHNWMSSNWSASRGDKISCSIKLIEVETRVISTNDAGTAECTRTQMNVNCHLMPCAEADSKWIMDVNAKTKTTKLLEENVWENFHDLDFRQRSLRCDFKSTT